MRSNKLTLVDLLGLGASNRVPSDGFYVSILAALPKQDLSILSRLRLCELFDGVLRIGPALSQIGHLDNRLEGIPLGGIGHDLLRRELRIESISYQLKEIIFRMEIKVWPIGERFVDRVQDDSVVCDETGVETAAGVQ